MILCFDVGNTQIYAAIYNGKNFIHSFRINTKEQWTSDQFGVFVKSIYREKNFDANQIKTIAISSVVPSVDYSLRSACIKYFNIDPFFLKTGSKTGIIIKYNNPHEIGADLIASAIAGINQYKDQNLIIADLGTASTFIAVSKKKEFLGGLIIPGIKTQMTSISKSAEKLFSVEINKPISITGKTTTHALQSGLYYNHLSMIEFLKRNMCKENFGDEECMLIGTGGFSSLFAEEKVFDDINQNLVLEGLIIASKLNGYAEI